MRCVAQAPSASLVVTIHDGQGASVLQAAAALVSKDKSIQRTGKAQEGSVRFGDLRPGSYQLTIEAAGFEKISLAVDVVPAVENSIDAILAAPAAHAESITVQGSVETALDQGPTPPTTLDREQVKNLPNRPATVLDALPLTPGIVSLPNGRLRLSGTGEHRSSMLVNYSDTTDPATGEFGATIPIDSVQTINVLSSPFLAEYGGFTSTVVSVETRKGGNKWNFEVNDPLPEFRWRSWHMVGLRSATPRVNFGGPLIKDKLYFLESVQYEMHSDPVITLSFPDNQRRREGYNSFTQFDYTLSSTNTLTATVHAADRHVRYENLDYFNPEAVTPNTSDSNLSVDVTDHAAIGRMLLESSLSASYFRAGVWAQGLQDMTLMPGGNTGNYFSQQTRTSSREEWRETLALSKSFLGTHNFKFGSIVEGTAERALVQERTVNIADTSGTVLETIAFSAGQSIHRSDVELGLFAQDQWTMGSRFALSGGVRVEQQEITESFRFGPRGGFVWTPFGGGKTVVRGGVGIFYDRVPLNVFGFAGYPEQTITRYADDGSVIYGPQTFLNITEPAAQHNLPLVYRKVQSPGDFSPYSTNYNLQLEQTLSPNLRFRVNYLQSRSGGLIVLTPEITSATSAYVLNGNGTSQLRQLEFVAAVRGPMKSQMNLSYVRSHATGNLNEFNNYLANFPPQVILPDAHTNLPGDAPNRFLAWGTIALPMKISLMPKIEYRTGFPWSPVDVLQNYVGTPNQARFPNYLSVDARVNKDFKVTDKYTLRIGISGSNLTDHFNPVSVHSNTADPAYGIFFGEYRRRYTADFDVIF